MPQSQCIAHLNDIFRRSFIGGKILLTHGITTLPEDVQNALIKAVQQFNDFTPDNDPHAEHDFGSIEISGFRIFWKIDYYDKTMAFGSENPADPSLTIRVLTIMMADEY